MATLDQLGSALAARGLTRSDAPASIIRILLWFPLLVLTLYLAWTVTQTWVALALAAFISLLQAQFAFIGHDACHGATARTPRANRLIGRLTMGVVGGLSFREWQHRHLLHHKHCQDQERDPDMQFGTAFSMSEVAREEKRGVGARIAPFQAWYLWPSTLLFAFSLRVLSLRGAMLELRRYGGDVVAVVGHLALFLGLPLLLPLDPLRVCWVYVAASMLLGLRLATVFTINHVGMPQRRPGAGHLVHQVSTSRNVHCPRWMDWYFGGLNFQIEHHLFPTCSRLSLRRVRAVVRPTIVEAGLPYHEVGWLSAMREVTHHVHDIAGRRPDLGSTETT